MDSKDTDMTPNVHQERLLAALTLWRDITGIDPQGKSFTMEGWSLKDTYDQLQQAIDLDPSGVTATMLLNAFHDHLLSTRTVSHDRLLREPEVVQRMLEPSRRLMDLLAHGAVQAERDSFIAGVRMALEQYGAAEREDIQALLGTPNKMAILRRDALRSMKTLRLDQFLDGAPEAQGVKPVYNRTVHQWWNINSLLGASTGIPSGVTLNLIRHPDEYQSYFAFTVRNGGNLFVLSDISANAHPLHGYMTRRPERRLDERAARHWFPYDLLGMTHDPESGECYLRAREERALAVRQTQSLPLKEVADLDAAELVWLSMMFDLLVDRFWRQGCKAPALSYTAEMLKTDSVLLDAAKSSNLPVPSYSPVALPPLTREAISVANAPASALGETGKQCNQWMEERYGHLVNEETLNLVAAPESLVAVAHQTGEIANLTQPRLGRVDGFQLKELLNGRAQLEVFDSASFGTREQLERDRIFIARVNYAKQIGRLAMDEFEQRKGEVLSWYGERVTANLDALLAWAGNESLWVNYGLHPTFSGLEGDYGRVWRREGSGRQRIRHEVMGRYWLADKDYPWSTAHTFGRVDERDAFRCAITDARASLLVYFNPTNPVELAWVAGCSVEELPDVLQHWSLFKHYNGNSILQRIDPMLWVTSNPWIKLDLRVRVPLSKRGLAQCEKIARRPDLPNLLAPAGTSTTAT